MKRTKLHDPWLEEEDFSGISAADYEKHLPTKEELKVDLKLNDQQRIYNNMLERLKVGTRWKGVVKGERGSVYHADLGGFDIQFYSNRKLNIGDDVDLFVIKNSDLKVTGAITKSLKTIKYENGKCFICWGTNSIPLKVYSRRNKKGDDELTLLEKGIIEKYLQELNIEGLYYYHRQFLNDAVCKPVNTQFEGDLLGRNMYKECRYPAPDTIDVDNPNFYINSAGEVCFKKYTQQPFYAMSSKIKKHGLQILNQWK